MLKFRIDGRITQNCGLILILIYCLRNLCVADQTRIVNESRKLLYLLVLHCNVSACFILFN